MEEVGVVKEIIGPKAIVAVQRKSGCDSCPGGSVCKLAGNEAEIEVVNEAKAKAGDTVRVVFKPYTYLKGTAFVYGIPSIMLIIGAIVGKEYLSRFLPNMDPDIVSAIGGFGLFALSFLFMKVWMKRYEGKKEYMPVIEEIIDTRG
ncbi:MAG: SoxR reducing system RseC family protein [Thermodesulfovibrionales bacterium]|jgi:positive regulator of sigma E activity|nr:SoxR reducing system RseC family protein [Thermodesulfovibrionales bacterium]